MKLSLAIGYYHQFMDNNQYPWQHAELFEDSDSASLANSLINWNPFLLPELSFVNERCPIELNPLWIGNFIYMS